MGAGAGTANGADAVDGVMSGGCDHIAVGIAAVVAGEADNAVLGAGGLGDDILAVVMPRGGNVVFRQHSAAVGADLLLLAIGAAGGALCLLPGAVGVCAGLLAQSTGRTCCYKQANNKKNREQFFHRKFPRFLI